MLWKTNWVDGEGEWEGRGKRRGWVQPRVPPAPCDLSSVMTCTALLLSCQDGEGLVDLHHDDDEEASGQQEGGPEKREQEGLGPIEAPVQDPGLILARGREAIENPVLVEIVSDFLYVGPGQLVVVQAAWDVGALWGEAGVPWSGSPHLLAPTDEWLARCEEQGQRCSRAHGGRGGRGKPELSKATGCPHNVVCEHGGPAAAQGPAGVLALLPLLWSFRQTTHPF